MPSDDRHLLSQVADRLGNYVYILVDPRDSMPFYVGKGVGTRMLQHGIDAAELSAAADETKGETSHKLHRIVDIRAEGHEPVIWVLRYGLSATEYTAVEAAAIDLLMSLPVVPASSPGVRVPLAEGHQLTNARREASRGFGTTTLEQLVDDLAAPALTTEAPLLLITLRGWYSQEEPVPGGGTRRGFGFKREWLATSLLLMELESLADSTRCWWRIDPRRVDDMGIEHVAAVYGGVTRALFRIIPGSWEQLRPGRRGFCVEPILHGVLYDEVVGPHGHRVPPKARGDQSQFNYWPRTSSITKDSLSGPSSGVSGLSTQSSDS